MAFNINTNAPSLNKHSLNLACTFWFVGSVFLRESECDDKQLSTLSIKINHSPLESWHIYLTVNFSLKIIKWKTNDGNPIEYIWIIKGSCDILPQLNLATTAYWSTWYTNKFNCSLMLQTAFNIFICSSLNLHNFKKYFRGITTQANIHNNNAEIKRKVDIFRFSSFFFQ